MAKGQSTMLCGSSSIIWRDSPAEQNSMISALANTWRVAPMSAPVRSSMSPMCET
jgi:hypothetical protein